MECEEEVSSRRLVATGVASSRAMQLGLMLVYDAIDRAVLLYVISIVDFWLGAIRTEILGTPPS